MAIPDFQSFFVPVLRVTADGREHSSSDIREKVAAELALAPEDLDQKLPSGVQTVFANRVTWSTVYLTKAGALKRLKRGTFQITERGQHLLQQYPTRFTKQALNVYPEFIAFSRGQIADDSVAGEKTSNIQSAHDSARTPEEDLISAYELLRNTLANEVLETVKKATPRFFEELVVDLLVAMGYGGSVADAGRAVGRSGDDGIDGIIKEDKLGLDLVYIQAKRWKDSVGRPAVQAFAGSLEGVRARKGVFIATSTFTADAVRLCSKN